MRGATSITEASSKCQRADDGQSPVAETSLSRKATNSVRVAARAVLRAAAGP
jgi:hypothetical protein